MRNITVTDKDLQEIEKDMPEKLSQCPHCHCMTKTKVMKQPNILNGVMCICGKCSARKDEYQKVYIVETYEQWECPEIHSVYRKKEDAEKVQKELTYEKNGINYYASIIEKEIIEHREQDAQEYINELRNKWE